MLTVCISASNMQNAGERSTSLLACRTIEKIIKTRLKNDAAADIIRLADAGLSSCTGCGSCFETGRCCADDDFNSLYSRIAGADAVFIISPHYAPIPAKLSVLLEKMEQLSYLRWFHDNSFRPAVYGIPVGIIAHGGGKGDAVLRSYKAMVLDTITNALQTIMMDVVGPDDALPDGVAFPVKEVREDKESIFPVQLYDWADIENRIAPLVEKVVEKASGRRSRGH